MKTVVTSHQVAHLWATCAQSHARNSNNSLFFNESIIYSYGYHFPIARMVQSHRGETAVLFTTRTYSITTANHINIVRNAIRSDIPVFYCTDPSATNPGVLEEYQERIKTAKLKAEKATKYTRHFISDIEHGQNMFLQYARFANISAIPVMPGQEWYTRMSERVAHQAKKEEQKEHNRELKQLEKRDKFLAQLPEWISGTRSIIFHPRVSNLRDFARQENKDLVTTRGARVPMEHVARVAKLIVTIIKEGRTYQRNGHTVYLGPFTLDRIDEEGTLFAGCHSFDKTEVLRIARDYFNIE